jgi:hypothetical protein
VCLHLSARLDISTLYPSLEKEEEEAEEEKDEEQAFGPSECASR